MRKNSQNISKSASTFKRSTASVTDDSLSLLAFDYAAQPNIISTVSTGKIVMANIAACKLMGYSKKELLTKSRAALFDINETGFKKMLQQRKATGQSIGFVTLIQKTGILVPCQIISAVFMDHTGIEKSITSITDLRQSIIKQKGIDNKKEKIVANNIVIAMSKQKGIDMQNRKIVANNIVIAKSKQKDIDIKKRKRVADNIVIAQSKQKRIDSKKDKTVAANIVLAHSRQKGIDMENRKIVADNIVLAQSRQKIIDNKKQKVVADNIVLAKSRQKGIDIANKKVVADNIVLAKSRQKGIDKENKKVVAGNIVLAKSRQKGIDIKNKKIVADNIILARSKQKGIDIRNKKTVANNIVLAKSRQKGIDIKNKKAVANNIVIIQARQKRIDIKNNKTVADNINLALAKSNEEKREQRTASLANYKEGFSLIFNSSSDVFFDDDLSGNEVIVSDAYEKEFGYKISGNAIDSSDWSTHIHPDDKAGVMEDYEQMLASDTTEWKCAYRFIKADGTIANVVSNRIVMRNIDGKVYRIIGSMHDISKQKVLEERLEHEIRLKEQMVTQATEDAKEMERSNIGKELHDNVNQLLGASRMYLQMAKKGGEHSEVYLARSSEYTLTAIEEIRILTRGLTTDIIKNMGLCVAIQKLADDMGEVNKLKISCSLKKFDERSVDNKFKLNLFRILQEHVNNILKHAQATYIEIRLLQDKKSVLLGIKDNGIGFDTRKKQNGIGVENIKSRALAYHGIAHFVSEPGKGCALNVTFPVTD